MNFSLTNYNSLLQLKVWKTPEESKNDNKFLYFTAKIKQELSDFKKEQETELLSDVNVEEDKISWMHNIPHGDKMTTLNGSTRNSNGSLARTIYQKLILRRRRNSLKQGV